MKKAQPIRRVSQGAARYVQLFVMVVRLLMAFTAVQMTGMPHVVEDVMMALHNDDDQNHLTDDCPNDRDGRECPPGCPDCHCTHMMHALPVLASPFLLELSSFAEIVFAPYAAQAPPRPAIGALYRPPRTHKSLLS